MNPNLLTGQALADEILSGRLPASAAMGRTDAFDALNAGANGPLPMLGTSAKIEAGGSVGVLSKVLYMQPGNESGREACASRTVGCTAACLAEGTGRMSMHGPRVARRRRHACFYADRNRFLCTLHSELAAHERAAKRAGKIAAARLDGTTNLPWHRMRYTLPSGETFANLHSAFPGIRFYEYTKHPLKVSARKGIPANLHLTFSVSEHPESDARATEYLHAGYGAAVVLAIPRHETPDTFRLGTETFPVVDGDAHDARFLDPAGSIVALAAKGFAKHDTTGFVRPVPAR